MAARWDLDRVRALDASDPLGWVRSRFTLPPGVIYLDGNSLGPPPAAVSDRLAGVVDREWGTALGPAWFDCGWLEAPGRVGDRIAPLIGAGPGEVLVCDTTSVVLAKLIGAALAAQPSRRVVLTTDDNFPSDLFAAGGMARHFGAELRVVPKADLIGALDREVAVCCLTHVDFRTGAKHDIPSVTAAAHGAEALMLWDLCHSVGAVPVGVADHGVDLAVGCTYKYLNGGPGSPSFLYVRRELQDRLENPLPGWLGHASPFDFELGWEPATGIGRFLTSTPPVLALAALDVALDVFDSLSIEAVREKSVALGQMLIEVLQDAGAGLEVASPLSPADRGAQVSVRHPKASGLIEALAERGVLGDHRAPDLCRFGLSPLYLSYEEVYRAGQIMVEVAASM